MIMAWLKKFFREGAAALGIISRPEFIALRVSDHPSPEALAVGVVYIVGGADYKKWAVFRCPKHEEEIVQLSLMPNRRPHWTIVLDFLERPTIHPSVRQLDGSYAHFWVRNGQVDWCADTGRLPIRQ